MKKIFGALIILTGVIVLVGFIISLLWNSIMVNITIEPFFKEITILESIGLVFGISLLSGNGLKGINAVDKHLAKKLKKNT